MTSTTDSPYINWTNLETLAKEIEQAAISPGMLLIPQWQRLEQAIIQLQRSQDWQGLLGLRLLFTHVCNRDSASGLPVIQRLEETAIHAARQLDDTRHLAIFLGDRGHNLHRQGFHQESLAAFEESSRYYAELGQQTYVMRNRHMTALCYRALNQWEEAFGIAQEILEQLPADDLWRGQPMQVLAWLYRDRGDLSNAEIYMREAVRLQRQSENSDILVAGSLADLGELLGLQGRLSDAIDAFEESLTFLTRHPRQYNRQEARTKLKLAEIFMQQGNRSRAAQLLTEADELCFHGQYYDQLWKISAAEAMLFFRSGKIWSAAQKAKTVFHIRRELGLSEWWFIRQVVVRLWSQLASRFRRK